MAYKIVIEIDEEDVMPDDVKTIATYVAEAMERAGLTHTVDCFKAGMKVMMRLKESQD